MNFFGVAYAGGFYVLVDPTFPKQRVQQIFGVLNPKVVITMDEYRESLKETGYEGLVLDVCDTGKDVDEELLNNIRKTFVDTDPLYGIFTSGSTGNPKGVVVCHRSVIDFIDVFTDVFNITDTSKSNGA